MADIRLDNDLTITNNDIEIDSSFRTTIIVSLFTNRRITERENNDNYTDLQGYWGNNDFGSKLWTLKRSKTTEATRLKAVAYAKQALQWMIDDGLCSKIDVRGYYVGIDRLNLEIDITKGLIKEQYEIEWDHSINDEFKVKGVD